MCEAYLEDEDLLDGDEEIVANFVLISINKYNVEQERILLITHQAIYRFKYNYNNSKSPIARYTKHPLREIRCIEKGTIGEKKTHFGFVLVLEKDPKASNHLYTALDFSIENTLRIIESIASAIKRLCGDEAEFCMTDRVLSRTKYLGSGVINKFGMGLYNEKKKKNGTPGRSSLNTVKDKEKDSSGSS